MKNRSPHSAVHSPLGPASGTFYLPLRPDRGTPLAVNLYEWSQVVEIHVNEHCGRWEITVEGDVPNVLDVPDPYEQIPDGSRVLQDSRGLTTADRPNRRWGPVAKACAERGLKIAIVVDRPMMFGLYRQTLLEELIDEEQVIAVFLDYEQAVRWLYSDRPSSEFRESRGD